MIGPTRRRALGLVAAAGLFALPSRAAKDQVHEWQGSALGGAARLVIDHPDARLAEHAARLAYREIDRLENEFSLFRPDSALSRLNRDGHLAAPSLDMRHLVSRSLEFAALSDGRFDVSVQPLWHAVAAGGDPDTRRRAASLVDWRSVGIRDGEIAFAKPGMALTLNGIAQGYIADRVAGVLQAAGIRHVLVDAGEHRALGPKRDGRPWRLDVGGGRIVELPDGALATSRGGGSRFDASGRVNHLLDPVTGESPPPDRQASVIADDAATADALATLLCLAPAGEAPLLLRRGGGRAAVLVEPGGRFLTFRV